MTMVAKPIKVTAPADRTDELKAQSDGVRWLSLPPRQFVMIDGAGPVGEAMFTERMPGLYTVAYSVHFALKRRGVDEHVWPIELLMWTTDGAIDFEAGLAAAQTDWRWRLMIGMPDGADRDELAAAVAAGQAKLPPSLAAELRVASFTEGDVAQIMHVGPYSEERPTIARLHAAIADAGFVPRGAHHEIYISNPQRTAPEKLRTIIRQPFARSESR
jgi:hypothetical protein